MHPKDCEHFAFSFPSINFREPAYRYHWVVLPQGMANSPTMCQVYVATALQPLRKKYSQMYIIHYMDDILLTAREEKVLLAAYADLQHDLRQAGLIIVPEKVQKEYPYQYLGHELLQKGIRPQKLQIRLDTLKTLNDFQKLLGDINWLRPSLRLSTGQLKPLFDILKGDALPNSPRKLTKEARECLELVQRALEGAHLYSKKIIVFGFCL